MKFEKSYIRMLIDFRLQKRSKMTSQNDLKTVKKSSRKNNEKNNRKKTPTCEKNLPPPNLAHGARARPPPCTPLRFAPLRGMECNSQPLSASSKPLSVIRRHPKGRSVSGQFSNSCQYLTIKPGHAQSATPQ